MSKDQSYIWISPPHMGGTELKYIQQAFADNWIAPVGPHINHFESDLAAYLGHAVEVAALHSGTAALHLALQLLGVGPGDEVICQSLTFTASANPIVYQGAQPVFVDSESSTWNLCPRMLQRAVEDRIHRGKKPKAIIAVHLYGMPYQSNEIRQIAQEYAIPIIEDAAEALGSKYNNRPCGTLGDLSVLSFNGNKIITTSGGGALICSSKELKQQAVFLATQARDEAAHYEHSQIGYNYRLSNICAGIGRGQLEVLETRIAQRRKIYQFYNSLFQEYPFVKLQQAPSDMFYSNHWLSVALLDPQSGLTPRRVQQALEKEQIESRLLWKPLHLQPVFKSAPYYGGTVAEELFETGICLPSGSYMDENELERIQQVWKEIVKSLI